MKLSTTGAAAAAILVLALFVPGCSDKKPDRKAAAPPPAAEAGATPRPHLLAAGGMAPDFTATAHDGSQVHLAALRGSPVVLYFYPKDETPGCIAEAESFRDELPDLTSAGAKVIGISLDSLDSHRAFAASHGINFPLVSDADGAIAASFGVSTQGGFAERTTFVIGPDGTIARVFPRVRVSGHIDEVRTALAAIAKSAGDSE
jgi:peroxiredoxin Q/BCP